ncbi:MAG TPA: hypothetical protein VH640_09800 [Bryobacteraceae bacterium]|jgi:hypothetical protein
MKVAALFPVGQTKGGCIAAIEQILTREEALNIYLLHGILAPGQNPPDPSDVAKQISATDFGRPVSYRLIAPIDTFDLSSAYAAARATVRSMAAEQYDRVYVGITGGANPLVASVFHSAMTYLGTEVVPIYVQGKGLAIEGTFVAEDIRLDVLAEESISMARFGQMRVAAQIADRLPETGKWLFARACLAALAAWDDFDYGKARDTLRRQLRHCADYQADPLLSGLADTVARLATAADRMVNMTAEFRNIQAFEKLASAPEWPSKVRENGDLLVADAVANAKRRFDEGRYTDSVLRSYRAAECATQVRLYEIGIHPAMPAAFGAAFSRTGGFVDGDKPLSFRDGLKLLRHIGTVTCEGIAKSVQDLGQTRNNAYLEHGRSRQPSFNFCALEQAFTVSRPWPSTTDNVIRQAD